jgi:broad specificity phosphatase PhoE
MSDITANTSHQFFVFRHGLATLSNTGYGDQVLTAPLLPEGIPSIERLATFLKDIPTDFHYTSEVLRCTQTADIVQKITGKEFQSDPRLNEYHQEPFQQFAERVENFLNDVIEKADRYKQTHPATEQPVSIVICTHGAVIAGIKHFLMSGTFSQEFELDYTQPGELLQIWKKSVQLHIF